MAARGAVALVVRPDGIVFAAAAAGEPLPEPWIDAHEHLRRDSMTAVRAAVKDRAVRALFKLTGPGGD